MKASQRKTSKNKTIAKESSKKSKSDKATFQLKDNRQESQAQKELQHIVNNSIQLKQASAVQLKANNFTSKTVQKQKKEEGKKIIQSKFNASSPIQLVATVFTNSKGNTYTVYDPIDITTALGARFRQWKRGNVTTSGQSAAQAVHMKSSVFNRLTATWRRRNDKTSAKEAIVFSADSSLSGGAGVKSLKAVSYFNRTRRSFVWHVRVVPD